jgi:hypothetical protein
VELLRVTAFSFVLGFALTGVVLACSGAAGAPLPSAPASADVIDPVVGAFDRGTDPAVAAVEANGITLCAGVLVAPDVVLTVRECAGPPCGGISPAAPASLAVRFGDGPGSAGPVSQVRDVVAAALGDSCDGGLSLLRLDTPVDGVQPLAVRATGAAQGDRVRTVGFDARDSGVGKTVRDHVLVTATTSAELSLHESPGVAGRGRVVVDDTAEVVGLVVGPDIDGDGSTVGDRAIRVDPFAAFVASVVGPNPTAGGSSRLRTTKGPVDMSADCAGAVDCAASVCVIAKAKQYCSRTCDGADRCPARWRCMSSATAWRVCVEM